MENKVGSSKRKIRIHNRNNSELSKKTDMICEEMKEST
jgi:hypothetical protein